MIKMLLLHSVVGYGAVLALVSGIAWLHGLYA